MSPSIGIVDDHPALILGAIEMLRGDPSITVTATASTVPELVTQGTDLDLVLLDLVLGDDSTPSANIRMLEGIGVPALIYTAGSNTVLIQEASGAGALGVILKSEHPGVLLTAVHDACLGQPVTASEWDSAPPPHTQFDSAGLTPRESEVLALYASGMTAEHVGRRLFIARSTVNEHIKRIRDKYGDVARSAHTKHELFLRAVEDGIIEWSSR